MGTTGFKSWMLHLRQRAIDRWRAGSRSLSRPRTQFTRSHTIGRAICAKKVHLTVSASWLPTCPGYSRHLTRVSGLLRQSAGSSVLNPAVNDAPRSQDWISTTELGWWLRCRQATPPHRSHNSLFLSKSSLGVIELELVILRSMDPERWKRDGVHRVSAAISLVRLRWVDARRNYCAIHYCTVFAPTTERNTH